MISRGRATAQTIATAVGDGMSFQEAAANEGLDTETSEAFRPEDDTPDLPGAAAIKRQAMGLATGAVSEFVPTPDGGLVFTVKERVLPSDEEFEAEKEQTAQLVHQQQRAAAWQAWVRDLARRKQASL